MYRNRLVPRLTGIALISLLTSSAALAGTLLQQAQSYRSAGFGRAGERAILVADVNGDGKPDIVEANGCSLTNCDGTVGVLLGNGDGTFQAVRTTDSGLTFASSIAVGDFNGDGKLDLVVSTGASCSPPGCVYLISVLLGNGDGTFGAPQLYMSGGLQAGPVAVADVNGDGKLDLVVGNHCSFNDCTLDGVVGVLLGNGDGTFGVAHGFDSGSRGFASLALGDVNGDGMLDVVTIHEFGNIGVLLGNGDGTFQPAQTYSAGGVLSYSIAVADVNGDSKADLLVTDYCLDGLCQAAAVAVLLGNGDGTFQPAQSFLTGASFAESVAVADINGDGKPDLVVANGCPNLCRESTVSVLLGSGDGTFKRAQKYSSGGVDAYSVTVADVNGDSNPDVLVANSCLSYTDCKLGGVGSVGSVGVLLSKLGKATSTTIVASLNPSFYGQTVTWTATVANAGSGVPTGVVNFALNGSNFATTTLSATGVASVTRANLSAGTFVLTAVYKGDGSNRGSTSAALNDVILPATSAATLGSSLNPSTQDQAVTFTAVVTSPTARPTGLVTFTDGKVVLGTTQLVAGKASLTTSTLPVGSIKITATFGGDSNISASSAMLTQGVN